MDRSVRLTRDLASEPISSEDCATIQLEPRRLLGDLTRAGQVEEDKTTRVDLSGLARFSAVGVQPVGCPEEAPTRRFSSARPGRGSAMANGAMGTADASPRVMSGVCTARGILPDEATESVPDAARATLDAEPRPSARVPLQQDTVIVRRHRRSAGLLLGRLLRGITVFAWGFSTATLLWIYLDRHPESRAQIVNGLSSLWTSYVEKPLK